MLVVCIVCASGKKSKIGTERFTFKSVRIKTLLIIEQTKLKEEKTFVGKMRLLKIFSLYQVNKRK